MYTYEEQRSLTFTEKGQIDFLRIRDKVGKLLKEAGAFQMEKVFGSGDTWTQLACVDRLIELGEIIELTQKDVRGQDRVFVAA